MIRSKEKESLLGQVETSTRETMRTMRGTAMARCFGLMEACMRASGGEEFSTVLEGWCFQMERSKKESSRTTYTSTPSMGAH